METPSDWTEQELTLYTSLQSMLQSLSAQIDNLPPEHRLVNQGILSEILDKTTSWRELIVREYEQVARHSEQVDCDSYNLQRTRDAMIQTIVAMLRTARENDADFLESHAHKVLHLIKEGVIFPERIPFKIDSLEQLSM